MVQINNLLVVSVLLVVLIQVTHCYIVQYPWSNSCTREYLYRDKPPLYFITRGTNPLNIDDVFICQQFNNTEYFLTRYSIQNKIPIYSAYKIKSFHNIHMIRRPRWRNGNELPIGNKATKNDYNRTYNRGHLNPRSFQLYSVESIKATFTLTNAVPMEWIFNKRWYDYAEAPLFNRMQTDCSFTSATRYILTGVIPSNSWMGRVNIPGYIWTAACCDTLQNRWFIGYLMDKNINLYVFNTVQQMEGELMNRLNGTTVNLYICKGGKRPRT